MDNCQNFEEACQQHITDLLKAVPIQDMHEATKAGMQLIDTAGKFTRWTAGKLAVDALSRAAGTSCAQCPVLKSFIHDCYDLVEQTQSSPTLTN